jgi:flagellar biosynthesis regulator FlaF
MTYSDIVKQSFAKGEDRMWKGIDRVSDFLEKQREKDPDEVRKFLKSEYIAMNGKHLNQHVAMRLVADMHHSEDVNTVKGELVRPEAAEKELLKGENKGDEWYWDAYVAANAMMHDLANTGLSDAQIMNAARHFFFHDEDFSDENKVFWYFEWLLF